MKKISLLFFVFSFLGLNAQKKVYLETVFSETEGPETRYVYGKLLKNKLEEGNIYEFKTTDRSEYLKPKLSLDSIAKKALKNDCETFMFVEINRLSGNLFVNIKYYNTSDLKRFWVLNKQVYSFDNLDEIAKAVEIRLNDGRTETLALVEEKNLLVSPTFNRSGYAKLVFGPIFPLYSTINPMNVLAGGGIGGFSDLRRFMFEYSVEAYFARENVHYFIKVEGLKPLSNTSNTFYLSGGALLGGIYLTNKEFSSGAGGFSVHGGLGYFYGRGTNLPLKFDVLRVYLPIFMIRDQYPMSLGSSFSFYF